MNISKVTLEQMLRARERRAERQRRLIEAHGLPLICFTMNIAGEVKNAPLIAFAFDEGLRALDASGLTIRKKEVYREVAGFEAYYVMEDDSPEEVKRRAVEIEEGSPMARLFDMDVIGAEGKKLARDTGRKCIVCSGEAFVCARSRAHGLDEVGKKTRELIEDFAVKKLALRAHEALILEVEVSPKPGLVDRYGSGAHDDMDIRTFKKSADALRPYFERFVRAGMDMAFSPSADLMAKLKKIGLRAEDTMYEATQNVNTHKGIIYSLGLLLADMGRKLMGNDEGVAQLVRADVERELSRARKKPATNGERLYREIGVTGARGQAANDFPCARRAAAALKEYKKRFCENDAAVMTLIDIMTELDDTNVLHRAGKAGLALMRREALKIASMPEEERVLSARALDEAFTKENISPGGCADTLALAIFLDL